MGLSITHVGDMSINENCKIGKNARIHVEVNIGTIGGNSPILGDNVYVGSGTKIFGDKKIQIIVVWVQMQLKINRVILKILL